LRTHALSQDTITGNPTRRGISDATFRREPRRREIRDELAAPRLERAIGVVYRPETELASHYFQAVLPEQFDEYIWFDETRAVTPLAAAAPTRGLPETYPFGL